MDELTERDLRSATSALGDLVERRLELRRACENAVIQWRWARASSDLQRVQPLYRERYDRPAPKLLEAAPAVPEDEEEYGFDAAGDIVVARVWAGPERFQEELRIRCDDTVVGYRWADTGEPDEVNVARFADGRLRSYVAVWPAADKDSLHGWSVERYEYEGDLVTEIHEESDVTFLGQPERETNLIRASYDALGRVLELRQHGDGGEKVLYRARGHGPSPETLYRHVEDRLVESVPKVVGEHAEQERIYCLVLHYHEAWPLPPRIGLGLERERQQWIDSIDDAQELKWTVWNPAEFSGYRDGTVNWDLTAIDPALARALAAIPQETDDPDDAADRGRATLNRAARRLQQLDWRLIAPVTDDFVVFAVDYELTHLEENLRHSVPAALRKALSSRALV